MLDGMWTALAFAVVGAIHLMPVAPVFVPETLSRLYGIAPRDQTLLGLMRHTPRRPARGCGRPGSASSAWGQAGRPAYGRLRCWQRPSTSWGSLDSMRSTAIQPAASAPLPLAPWWGSRPTSW